MIYLPNMLVSLTKTGQIFVVKRITGNGSLELYDGVVRAVARPADVKRVNLI